MPSSLQLSLCQPQADEIVLSTLLSLALVHSLAQTHYMFAAPVGSLRMLWSVVGWAIPHQSPGKTISHR